VQGPVCLPPYFDGSLAFGDDLQVGDVTEAAVFSLNLLAGDLAGRQPLLLAILNAALPAVSSGDDLNRLLMTVGQGSDASSASH
jgi:hypothetical protein